MQALHDRLHETDNINSAFTGQDLLQYKESADFWHAF